MPTDTSQSIPVEVIDEHVETEPGATLDPRDVDLEVVAPENPTRPLRLRRQPPAIEGLSPTTRARLTRAERTVLTTQIGALERTVEQREKQLDSVITRYETILDEERGASDEEPPFDRDRATTAFSHTTARQRVRGVFERVATAARAVLER